MALDTFDLARLVPMHNHEEPVCVRDEIDVLVNDGRESRAAGRDGETPLVGILVGETLGAPDVAELGHVIVVQCQGLRVGSRCAYEAAGQVRAENLTADLAHKPGVRSEEHTSELQSLMR